MNRDDLRQVRSLIAEIEEDAKRRETCLPRVYAPGRQPSSRNLA